jgi:NAD(P)-dependent dehydrogenase (short-subunit alcohol dehydrogenase family)
MDLQGSVAIVTGAASGIGKATARVFGDEGAKVVLADINETGAKETEEELAAAGIESAAIAVDLADPVGVRALVDSAVSRFGRIDALVNVAGASYREDTVIEDVPDEIFDKTFAVNARSVFLTSKYTVPVMKSVGGGALVHVSSLAAVLGIGGISYTASKGAVASMSRQIAYHGARHNIRSNCILCGVIETPMLEGFSAKVGLVAPPTVPGQLPRRGRPDEVAYLAAFLASGKAAYITGSTYTIDGGWTQK